MKKYFIMAVAVLATLTACQPDEPQTVVQTREISFAPAATQTRATAAEEITVANLKKFAVSGFVKANDGAWSADNKIFNNTAVQTSAETVTTASIFEVVNPNDVKYWAESSDYKFSAVYPVPTDWSYSYNYEDSKFTQSISNFSISADNTTPDLLVAKEATASLTAAQTTNYAVGLNFYHMLSRVKFSFQNGFPDDNISIEVSKLKLLDVTKTASATIALNNEGKLNASWNNPSSEKIDVLFYDNNNNNENLVVLGEGVKDALASVYRLIIPETKEYSVAFDLVIKSEGNVIATIPYQKGDGDDDHNPIPLKATTFVNGQSYVFNAVIKETIFNEDDLHPITFTVDVEPWGEDTVVDNDIFTPDQPAQGN